MSNLDDISVAIGRLQATVEAQTATLSDHGRAHGKIIQQQDEMMKTCALIPGIQTKVNGLGDRTGSLERERDQRKGAMIIISGVTGAVGAILVKFGDVFFR
jgi:hypothetical protein